MDWFSDFLTWVKQLLGRGPIEEIEFLHPRDDPTSLGNLAVKKQYITREQLHDVVGEFNTVTGTMLGRFMVQKDVIDEAQLKMLLLKQKVARSGKVEEEDLFEAMRLAGDAQQKMDTAADRLIEASAVAADKTGSKPES